MNAIIEALPGAIFPANNNNNNNNGDQGQRLIAQIINTAPFPSWVKLALLAVILTRTPIVHDATIAVVNHCLNSIPQSITALFLLAAIVRVPAVQRLLPASLTGLFNLLLNTLQAMEQIRQEGQRRGFWAGLRNLFVRGHEILDRPRVLTNALVNQLNNAVETKQCSGTTRGGTRCLVQGKAPPNAPFHCHHHRVR